MNSQIEKMNQQGQQPDSQFSQICDKLMQGVISNVSEISQEKIKQTFNTQWVKSSLFVTGKSLISKFFVTGFNGWRTLGNFNIGLFVAGLVADSIVNKVSSKLQVENIRKKVLLHICHLEQMTQKLKEINISLDGLIWKCFNQVNSPQEYGDMKQKIDIFLQKHYLFRSDDSNLIYCPDTDDVIIMNQADDDDFVVLSTAKFELKESQIDDGYVVDVTLPNQKIEINHDYLQ